MQINSDIRFLPGINYVLVIDTNSYTGGFEREMAAYVAGAHDEERYHGDTELEEFKAALKGENGHQLNTIQAMVTSQMHEEYGEVTNTIWPTPGRLNDGVGGHYDAKSGETGWPAYESVAIFMDSELDAAQLKLVRERAEKYGETRVNLSGKPEPISIIGVRIVKVKVEVMV